MSTALPEVCHLLNRCPLLDFNSDRNCQIAYKQFQKKDFEPKDIFEIACREDLICTWKT
jgi:hypothetical protein